MPEEPLTVVDEMTGYCRELFESLIRAGFTEWQACQIVASILTAGSR
jgi:hypothetical protein